MTLPASPPITLAQIQAEFGAPAGTGITSFYRGGTYVPNTAPNAGVPTSGSIGLLSLLGASAYTPMIVSAPNVSGDSFPGTNAIFGSSASSVTGGLAPFTIAWTFQSGTTFTLGSPSSATTTFARPGNPPQGSAGSATYRVTYTDATTATAFKDITVNDSRA